MGRAGAAYAQPVRTEASAHHRCQRRWPHSLVAPARTAPTSSRRTNAATTPASPRLNTFVPSGHRQLFLEATGVAFRNCGAGAQAIAPGARAWDREAEPQEPGAQRRYPAGQDVWPGYALRPPCTDQLGARNGATEVAGSTAAKARSLAGRCTARRPTRIIPSSSSSGSQCPCSRARRQSCCSRNRISRSPPERHIQSWQQSALTGGSLSSSTTKSRETPDFSSSASTVLWAGHSTILAVLLEARSSARTSPTREGGDNSRSPGIGTGRPGDWCAGRPSAVSRLNWPQRMTSGRGIRSRLDPSLQSVLAGGAPRRRSTPSRHLSCRCGRTCG